MEASTSFQQLLYEERGDVAYLTLNRPEATNALSLQLSDEIVAAVEQVRQSADLKFAVVQGAGENFCAGDDLKEMARGLGATPTSTSSGCATTKTWPTPWRNWTRSPLPPWTATPLEVVSN